MKERNPELSQREPQPEVPSMVATDRIDSSLSFDDIGGLDEQIRQVKEIVLFPLCHKAIFGSVGANPPRGILFYGPPGCGKTLVCRVLASMCSNMLGQKVSFFLKNGADCLSKWVGESEKQLRLLFLDAKKHAPSIIFFDEIGGLDEQIRQVKEIVLFPLCHKAIFGSVGANPPRGILFYGPPGCGKTLVCRVLASMCSNMLGQKVSFFLKNGADCLSKWVGESEKQLRLLFLDAKKHAPSIIFFDEIDGLCPQRSSKQDQIHSSIVSTLLSLLDGLEDRGDVIVIGATNRADSLDAALRRPGRFDREILFTAPDLDGRVNILKIHTKKWVGFDYNILNDIAGLTEGFSGADLNALCNETAIMCLRRTKPHLYVSVSHSKNRIGCSEEKAEEKEEEEEESICPEKIDFICALKRFVPTYERSSVSFSHDFGVKIDILDPIYGVKMPSFCEWFRWYIEEILAKIRPSLLSFHSSKSDFSIDSTHIAPSYLFLDTSNSEISNILVPFLGYSLRSNGYEVVSINTFKNRIHLCESINRFGEQLNSTPIVILVEKSEIVRSIMKDIQSILSNITYGVMFLFLVSNSDPFSHHESISLTKLISTRAKRVKKTIPTLLSDIVSQHFIDLFCIEFGNWAVSHSINRIEKDSLILENEELVHPGQNDPKEQSDSKIKQIIPGHPLIDISEKKKNESESCISQPLFHSIDKRLINPYTSKSLRDEVGSVSIIESQPNSQSPLISHEKKEGEKECDSKSSSPLISPIFGSVLSRYLSMYFFSCSQRIEDGLFWSDDDFIVLHDIKQYMKDNIIRSIMEKAYIKALKSVWNVPAWSLGLIALRNYEVSKIEDRKEKKAYIKALKSVWNVPAWSLGLIALRNYEVSKIEDRKEKKVFLKDWKKKYSKFRWLFVDEKSSTLRKDSTSVWWTEEKARKEHMFFKSCYKSPFEVVDTNIDFHQLFSPPLFLTSPPFSIPDLGPPLPLSTIFLRLESL
ncbi:Tat-binding homolog 7 [Aduncisulcus paluster]|uniref:Tat-binding homolog 7 n=1 Tax=Aduncisulcus paluster TaxID=2918883 RepID=A0ABQ5KR14_9EUKA|nr:Tat-binding homolog 7 [Aduncisulcus paluster]